MALNRDKVTASAIKLLQAGKYDKAIAEFRRLVDDDPSDVRTLLKIGDTYVKMGRTREAIDAYEQVATLYSDQGFYLKAVAVYKQMLRVDSTMPEIHLKLAEMYQQLNLSSDALQHYQQVAVVYEQQGRSQETLNILKRMVDLDPDNLPSRIKLAELFAQQGMSNEAIQEFRSATEYLKEQERIDDYIRVAERLIYFDPSAIDVTREVAQIYMQRGDHKVALGKLQVCFKADPRNLDTLKMIGTAFRAMGQNQKAISVYREMARIHQLNGDTAEARSGWEQVLELVPGDGEAMQALGMAPAAPAPAAPAPGGAALPGMGAPAGGAALPGMGAAPAPAAAPQAPTPTPPPQGNPEDEQFRRLMTETDVYVKYGLRDKALEHLDKMIEMRPDHLDAHEKKKSIAQELGQGDAVVEALQQLVVLGEKVKDPRLSVWRKELNEHNRPAEAAAPAPLPPDDDEEIILDDDALILEPDSEYDEAPVDEAAPLMSAADELPDDLDLGGGASLDGLPSDESMGTGAADMLLGDDDDEMILDDDAMIMADDDEMILDDDAMIIGGDEPAVGLDDDDDIAAAAQALLDDSPDLVGDLDAGPDDLILPANETAVSSGLDAESQALVADALSGMEDMGDLGDLDEALRVAESFIQEEALEDEGVDYDEAADGFDAGDGFSDDGFSDDGGVPEEFDDENYVEEDFASTEIMSLSPEEMAEIRAFADESKQAAAPVPDAADMSEADTDQFPAASATAPSPIDDFGAPADDGFSEATVAMSLNPQDIMAGKLPPELQQGGPGGNLMADASDAGAPAAELSELSLEAPADDSEEMPAAAPSMLDAGDLDAVAAAALGTEDLPDAPPPLSGDGLSDDVSDDAMLLSTSDVEPLGSSDMSAMGGVSQEGGPVTPKLGVSEQAHGFADDIATQFYPDEMEEAEFFIQQGLYDEAREILEEIADELEDSQRAPWMLARVTALENDEPEPPAPWETALEESLQEELGDFDLEGALDSVLPEDDMQVSVDEVLSAFKKGVAETVDEGDAETHYNLGIAYREMGLSNEAIGEFELSSKAPSKAVDSFHLIGLCHQDGGSFEQALAAFDSALSSAGINAKQKGTNEYQRGVCLMELGRPAEASEAFAAAKALKSDMPDLEKRLQDAQAAGGAGAAPSRPSKNIDYV